MNTTESPAGRPAAIMRFASAAVSGLRACGRQAADMLIPAVCVSCGTPLASHDVLCSACWQDVDFIRPPLCDRLGIPLPFDTGGPAISAKALADPPPYERARAIARYSGVMRELIHGLKYGDQHHAIRLLARWLGMAGREILDDTDLLVPTPLSRLKLWRRRFNQSALITRALARQTGVTQNALVLERHRHTASQVGLTLDQRQRNVQGAFAVPPSHLALVRGRSITLVDDVITTGATVAAATRALKKAGARRVDVLALALVTGDTPTSA